MPKRRWTSSFQELRGRWIDNPKIVQKIVEDSKSSRDWTLRLKPFMAEGAENVVPKGHHYRLPPDLRQVCFDKLDLSGCSFRYSALTGATAYRCSAEGLDCTGSKLDKSRWADSRIQNGIFVCVHAPHAYFSHSALQGCDFSKSDLRYANFRDADLSASDFTDADLRFVHLSEARCDNANFSGAKLYGASLWGITYNKVKCNSIDISPEGDGSVITNDIQLAPLVHLLTVDRRLAQVIEVLKLRTVVILGRDSSPEGIQLLNRIAALIAERGLIPILVKDQGEIVGEPFLKKALMYSLLARYVIAENSSPSGHIAELPKALSDGCVLAVLQKRGQGSTWLLEEEFVKYRTIERFWYVGEDFEQACSSAFQWCEQKTKELGATYAKLYEALDLTYVSGQQSNADPPVSHSGEINVPKALFTKSGK
jgi:uncharacterized protein YjbI with pentapeptide repeats